MRTLLIAGLCGLASAAQAGDQGDQQSCDGSTAGMVECLKAQTAQWDKRMTIAYQQATKNAADAQRDQLRAAQRLWIQYRDANCRITPWARVPSPASMPASACAA